VISQEYDFSLCSDFVGKSQTIRRVRPLNHACQLKNGGLQCDDGGLILLCQTEYSVVFCMFYKLRAAVLV